MIIPARAASRQVSQFVIPLHDGYSVEYDHCGYVRAVYSQQRRLFRRWRLYAVRAGIDAPVSIIRIQRLRVCYVWQLWDVDAHAQGLETWRVMLEDWARRHDDTWWRWLAERGIIWHIPLMIRYRPPDRWRCVAIDYERLEDK